MEVSVAREGWEAEIEELRKSENDEKLRVIELARLVEEAKLREVKIQQELTDSREKEGAHMAEISRLEEVSAEAKEEATLAFTARQVAESKAESNFTSWKAVSARELTLSMESEIRESETSKAQDKWRKEKELLEIELETLRRNVGRTPIRVYERVEPQESQEIKEIKEKAAQVEDLLSAHSMASDLASELTGQLKASEEELSRVTSELSRVTSELKRFKGEAEGYKEELRALKKEQRERRVASTVEELKERLSPSKELKRAKEEAAKVANDLRETERRLTAVMSLNAELEEVNSDLRDGLSELEARVENAHPNTPSRTTVKPEVKASDAESTSVAAQLAATEKELESSKADTIKVADKRRLLETELKALLFKHDENEKALKAANEQVSFLEEKVAEGARRRAHLLERAEHAENSLRNERGLRAESEKAFVHTEVLRRELQDQITGLQQVASQDTPPRLHTNSAFSLTPRHDEIGGLEMKHLEKAHTNLEQAHILKPPGVNEDLTGTISTAIRASPIRASPIRASPASSASHDRLLRSIIGPVSPIRRSTIAAAVRGGKGGSPGGNRLEASTGSPWGGGRGDKHSNILLTPDTAVDSANSSYAISPESITSIGALQIQSLLYID